MLRVEVWCGRETGRQRGRVREDELESWEEGLKGRGTKEVEEDNIDPLVAPPLLTQRRHHYIIHHPSVYSTCAHTYGHKPTRPQPSFRLSFFCPFLRQAHKIPFSFYFSVPFPLLFHQSNPWMSILWLEPKTTETEQCR